MSGDGEHQGHKTTVHGVGLRTREFDPDETAAWIDIIQLGGVLDASDGVPSVYLTFDNGSCSDVLIALPGIFEQVPSVTSVVRSLTMTLAAPVANSAELHDRNVLKYGDDVVDGMFRRYLRALFVAASATTCSCSRAAVSVERVQPWTR